MRNDSSARERGLISEYESAYFLKHHQNHIDNKACEMAKAQSCLFSTFLKRRWHFDLMHIQQKLRFSGVFMPNLEISSRALSVVDYSRNLFNVYGFQQVGVDRIIGETNVAKATFYNYFQSKEKLIELCLLSQKQTLEEKIGRITVCYRDSTLFDQLKKIYLLHADLNGPYHLLFKAIFEIERLYPNAYQIVVEYRTWLLEQILSLLLNVKSTATMEDAAIFLFIMDGTVLELRRMNRMNEKDVLLNYFLRMI